MAREILSKRNFFDFESPDSAISRFPMTKCFESFVNWRDFSLVKINTHISDTPCIIFSDNVKRNGVTYFLYFLFYRQFRSSTKKGYENSFKIN
jgi:hypothetical protein